LDKIYFYRSLNSFRTIFNLFKDIIKTERVTFFVLILSIVIYVSGIFSIFPKELKTGSYFVDILTHYLGFTFGFFVPWFVFGGSGEMSKF